MNVSSCSQGFGQVGLDLNVAVVVAHGFEGPGRVRRGPSVVPAARRAFGAVGGSWERGAQGPDGPPGRRLGGLTARRRGQRRAGRRFRGYQGPRRDYRPGPFGPAFRAPPGPFRWRTRPARGPSGPGPGPAGAARPSPRVMRVVRASRATARNTWTSSHSSAIASFSCCWSSRFTKGWLRGALYGLDPVDGVGLHPLADDRQHRGDVAGGRIRGELGQGGAAVGCCWRSSAASAAGGMSRTNPARPGSAPGPRGYGLVVGDRAVHDVLPHDLEVAPRLILAHETTADHQELAEVSAPGSSDLRHVLGQTGRVELLVAGVLPAGPAVDHVASRGPGPRPVTVASQELPSMRCS